jgi:cyclic pyranopterin phosphate synthase
MNPSTRVYTLRVNIQEQCQYRCPYCLPGSVSPYTPNAQRLTPAEYARLARLFAGFGVRKVRFTGGEPLLRPDVVEVVRAFRNGMPGADLAVTTNGQYLSRRLEALVAAGLRRATVHVDSLRPERYRALMGNADVEEILASVLAARERLSEVKLNTVIQRGRNDDEVHDFLDWSRKTGVQVRFIELMNTGSAVDYTRSAFFSGREILARVRESEPVEPIPRKAPSDPAALFRTASGLVFGVIASDTEPFCATCDRLRLTPEGRLRGCLYQSGGVELGAALRAGVCDSIVSMLMASAIRRKRSHHPELGEQRTAFSMSEAGG